MASGARFTLRLDAELKQWLEAEAARQDRSVAWLAKRAIETMKADAEHRRRAIRAAIAEADKGVFVSGEAVNRWMDSWDTDAELPPPEPDIFLKKA
ncbi:MAG: CopG family ribbon-helix-helix protein [Paracoccaceae bacterium]